jgi:hypothetical protein
VGERDTEAITDALATIGHEADAILAHARDHLDKLTKFI